MVSVNQLKMHSKIFKFTALITFFVQGLLASGAWAASHFREEPYRGGYIRSKIYDGNFYTCVINLSSYPLRFVAKDKGFYDLAPKTGDMNKCFDEINSMKIDFLNSEAADPTSNTPQLSRIEIFPLTYTSRVWDHEQSQISAIGFSFVGSRVKVTSECSVGYYGEDVCRVYAYDCGDRVRFTINDYKTPNCQ